MLSLIVLEMTGGFLPTTGRPPTVPTITKAVFRPRGGGDFSAMYVPGARRPFVHQPSAVVFPQRAYASFPYCCYRSFSHILYRDVLCWYDYSQFIGYLAFTGDDVCVTLAFVVIVVLSVALLYYITVFVLYVFGYIR